MPGVLTVLGILVAAIFLLPGLEKVLTPAMLLLRRSRYQWILFPAHSGLEVE